MPSRVGMEPVMRGAWATSFPGAMVLTAATLTPGKLPKGERVLTLVSALSPVPDESQMCSAQSVAIAKRRG